MYRNIKITDLTSRGDVYVDCSAIRNPGFRQLMIDNASELKRNGQTLAVHRAVTNELKKIYETGNFEGSSAADECLNMIKALDDGGVIQYIGNHLDPRSAHQQYLELIITYRNKKELSVISDDDNFLHDVLLQNSILSFNGKPVSAYKITENGELLHVGEVTTHVAGTTGSHQSEITQDQISQLMKMFGLD